MSVAGTTGRALVAEALGSFVLVLLGVGAALMSGGDYVATGLGFGAAVLVMVYAVGRVSGGHFNPAVSLAAAIGGRLSWSRCGLYWLVQVAGALLAGATLWALMRGFPGYPSTGHLGQNSFGDAGSGFAWWAALPLEALMTALFVGVVLAVTDEGAPHPALAPLAIGLGLAAVHFASMRATGTSVNPARSVGVGLFAGPAAVRQLWLFIVAPLLGGVVAGVGYLLLRGRRTVRAAGTVQAQPAPFQPLWGPGDPLQWGQPAGAAYPDHRRPPPPAWETGHLSRPPAGTRPIHPSEPQAAERRAAERRAAAESGPGRERTGRDEPPIPPDWRPPRWTPPGWDEPVESTPPASPQSFPPLPSEPYWSQQLPVNWDLVSGDDEDGRTQIRPPGGH